MFWYNDEKNKYSGLTVLVDASICVDYSAGRAGMGFSEPD